MAFLLIAFLAFTGCVTTVPSQPPRPPLEIAFEEGSHVRVLEILYHEENRDHPYWEQSLGALQEQLESNEVPATQKELILSSLVTLDETGENGFPGFLMAEEFLSTGALAPLFSLAYIQGLKDESSISDWAQLLNSELPDYVLPDFVNNSEATSNSLDLEAILEATVTIVVDKGNRMENGVSFPDGSLGSGFFIDDSGHIITNYHVIQSEVDPEYEGYSRAFIRLRTNRGEKIPVKVIGWDPVLDIALLESPLTETPFIPLSYGRDVMVGDTVRAIGSPVGLESTITSGVISNTSRYLYDLGTRFQVDVPINPGNSGGPLVNTLGEVIGIVYMGAEQFEGLNFVIPVDYLHAVMPRLFLGGKVEHFSLGVQALDTNRGLVVNYVKPSSPADRMGILKGDTIKTINGVVVEDLESAHEIMLYDLWGSLNSVSWERDAEEFRFLALPEIRPENPWESAVEVDNFGNILGAIMGMKLLRLGDPDSLEYLVDHVYPGYIGDEFGFTSGDPIQIRRWDFNRDEKTVLIFLDVEKRENGYLENRVGFNVFLSIPGYL